MKKIIRILHSVIAGVLIIIYTVTGAAIVLTLFPFFGRRKYVDVATRIWIDLMLFTCGVKVTVEGLENIDKDKAYIFVVNHQSLFDVPACVKVIPARLRMLAKKELFRIPMFGWGMSAIGHIKIDRENSESAIASLEKAVERLKTEDISPVVYPEGTRSPDGKIHRFKKGAFVLAIKSGRSIVPVTIQGSRNILQKKSLYLNPGKVHVIIDKPVETTGFEVSKRNELAIKIHDIIEARFYGREPEQPVDNNKNSDV
ncbi:lysophospholipid acyltransferase family protein [candidate division KSB1 bacterium]